MCTKVSLVLRHKSSCQIALIKLIDSWMECVDNEDMIGAFTFDLVGLLILLKLSNSPVVEILSEHSSVSHRKRQSTDRLF